MHQDSKPGKPGVDLTRWEIRANVRVLMAGIPYGARLVFRSYPSPTPSPELPFFFSRNLPNDNDMMGSHPFENYIKNSLSSVQARIDDALDLSDFDAELKLLSQWFFYLVEASVGSYS